MNMKHKTLLVGLTFAAAACAQRQTEVDTGEVEPADTTIAVPEIDTIGPEGAPADTGFAPPADTGFAEPDTGFAEPDTGFAADTGIATDTAFAPDTGMADTATMSDTTTVESETGEVAGSGVVWQATLLAPEGAPQAPGDQTGGINVGGTAFVMPAEDGRGTSARVQLKGGTPGAAHPWHIHKGKCGADQGIVGPADAYHPIVVGQDGQAEVDVILPIPTPTTGEYIVNVHKSPSELGTIIACGQLTTTGGQ